jgi:cyclopropane fatty-acyl-phospholipid synthase-like methyltransferase
MTLPFSQSCENNKDSILSLLKGYFSAEGRVLEIAGGTGQHAVYFAQNMPWLTWQSSDLPSNVESLNLRIATAQLPTLPLAAPLDVTQADWQVGAHDYVFSANCLHIMSEQCVVELFAHLDDVITLGGKLCVYGPFKYQGEFTSESNANFDLSLKQRDPRSGIRDFELVNGLAEKAGLALIEDHAMPANNQLLSWAKVR